MSVSLQKGQKVDLTKGNASLKKVVVGLGWDEAEQGGNSGGFLGKILGGGAKTAIDCDASAILCGVDGKVVFAGEGNKISSDVIYFGNLQHPSGSVKHMGDNLTGAGEGDDEQIVVDLSSVPAQYERIVFVVNIYEAKKRNQHFGFIKNAFIRLVDAANNQELCKYNLSENYTDKTSMIFGELYRYKGEWKFNAMGEATLDGGLGELYRRYK